jgi:phosphoinositide-3-kinase regulatory subunit 4
MLQALAGERAYRAYRVMRKSGLTEVDPEEAVVARVVLALTSLASLGLLPRMRLWDVFFAVRGFLCHPNSFIRQGERACRRFQEEN